MNERRYRRLSGGLFLIGVIVVITAILGIYSVTKPIPLEKPLDVWNESRI